MIERRKAVLMLATGLLALCLAPLASATVARAVVLKALAHRSQLIATGTPLEAYSRWEDFGGRRRIVTYTRVRVDDRIAGADQGPEVLVRTLGGQVGDIGQVVAGEAVLVVGQPSLLFLVPRYDGVLGVTAMAQGQFPLRADAHGVVRLSQSPNLPKLVQGAPSAQQQLAGRTPGEATTLIRQALHAK